MKQKTPSMGNVAAIPLRHIGPVKICGPVLDDELMAPLATYETTLWPSTNRGAKVSRQVGGIFAAVVQESMTRSVIIQAKNAATAIRAVQKITESQADWAAVVSDSSRFARLTDIHSHIVGNVIYLRLAFSTADAAGHNMATLAAQHIQTAILQRYSDLHYVSLSGNYCTDKKVSAVNSILGRGKYVIAELIVPAAICRSTLKTTPQQLVDLHIKKNLMGSITAGSFLSANAHFANVLLATYLATGQDAANIVEGSQGVTHVEIRDEDLYFSVTLPNIIVGTVGHGKDLPFVQENLRALGCLEKRAPGDNARRLACIIGATVLCAELSLLAALTNPRELMRAHRLFERKAS